MIKATEIKTENKLINTDNLNSNLAAQQSIPDCAQMVQKEAQQLTKTITSAISEVDATKRRVQAVLQAH